MRSVSSSSHVLSGRGVSRGPNILLSVLLILFTSCGDSDSPTDSTGVTTITAMTWNVYIGGDVQTAFTSLDNPLSLPGEVSAFWESVQASDFPSRAQTIASIISRESPHIVGLQEVSRFLTQSPGDFLAGNPIRANDIAIDFLDELLSALSSAGVSYSVASVVENSDIEFISISADDIRQIDREVLLVRSDVTVVSSRSGRYESQVTVPLIGDASIDIPRGWVMADIMIGGEHVRLVSTHLEVGGFRDIQASQAAELVQESTTEPVPTILLGDFNSNPSRPIPNGYSTLVEAGYDDGWLTVGSGLGNTCCHDDYLRNEIVSLSGRIDMLLHSDGLTPVSSRVVGNQLPDRTLDGLWPSDHAGVVATYTIP